METKNFKERLIFFCKKHADIGYNAFEKKCSIPLGTISGIRNGISTTTLTKILVAFPELNVYWLLLGEGEMLRNAPILNEKVLNEDLCHSWGESSIEGKIEGKDKEIDFLRELVLMQQATIKKVVTNE